MAAQLGLDVERFAQSLVNPLWTEVLARDRVEAETKGLTDTPAVLLNGVVIDGPITLQTLLQKVDDARIR
jgi:predicted DsbA family dithiol-disulfide isomerase